MTSELLAADREVLYDVRTVPRPDGYHLLLPSNWTYVDIRPNRSARSIRRLVEDRIRRNPDLAAYRKELLGLFRAMVNDALAHDVERLAVLSEAIGDAPLGASLTVARAAGVPAVPAIPAVPAVPGTTGTSDSPDPGGGGYTNHPDALLAAARQAADEGSDQVLPAPDREVELVAAAQQVVVRSAGPLVTRDPRTGHTAESFQAQYWIPEPGTTDLAVLTLASPCGGPALDPLTALFDLIALSFLWSWPPT